MHVKTCTMQRIQRDQYKARTHTYLSILRGTQDITERLDNRRILVYHLELFGGLLKQYMKFLIIYMYMYMIVQCIHSKYLALWYMYVLHSR